MYACKMKDLESVKTLLDMDANPNTVSDVSNSTCSVLNNINTQRALLATLPLTTHPSSWAELYIDTSKHLFVTCSSRIKC